MNDSATASTDQKLNSLITFADDSELRVLAWSVSERDWWKKCVHGTAWYE
jgi:hypothetical protein